MCMYACRLSTRDADDVSGTSGMSSHKQGDPTQPSEGGPLRLPVTNIVHIDVQRIVATLKLYEKDRLGFFEQIPRLR